MTMGPAQEREFRDFVASRSGALLRSAYVLTGDAHEAHDLLQITLMHAARNWSGIEGSADGYVRQTMYRHQVNRWRARARRPRTVLVEPADRPIDGDHANDTAVRHELFDALRTLAPRQRTVVVLRYYEDRPEAEVAELLGVTVGTVRSQAAKALARLRTTHPHLIGDGAPAEEVTR